MDALRFENCTAVFFNVEVPEEWARPTLPEEFDPRGTTPVTVGLAVEARECERAVVADQVATGVRFVTTIMAARPVNRTWHEYAGGVYFLDVYAGSPELGGVLARFGMPHEVADIAHDSEVLPDGSRWESWAVDAHSAHFDFSNLWENVPGQASKSPFSRYFESSGFRRVDVWPDEVAGGVAFGLKASVLTIGGDSKMAAVLHGLNPVPGYGQSILSQTQTWNLNATVYR